MALDPVFSFNWTTWPFVEVGDSKSPTLQQTLPTNVANEIQEWSTYFLENFDEKSGFSSLEAKVKITSEFERLCLVLDLLDVKFRADNWWSTL